MSRAVALPSLERVRRVLPLLLCALVAFALACQGTGGPQQVRGVVVNVEATSIARATGLTVRGPDGRDYHFRVDPSVDWTPGHLREHMALGQPVVVQYRQEGDDLLAIGIDDG